MPFQCFWQELWWFLPGGLKRRADYIRDEVIGLKYSPNGKPLNGVICGSGEQAWHYKAVVEGRLYEACAKDVLPNFGGFLFSHFFIPSIPLLFWVAFHYAK